MVNPLITGVIKPLTKWDEPPSKSTISTGPFIMILSLLTPQVSALGAGAGSIALGTAGAAAGAARFRKNHGCHRQKFGFNGI